nr:uncharacterized protein LOC111419891 [Onthophagus taurus]
MSIVETEEFFEDIQSTTNARKRKSDKSKWKKNVLKKNRYELKSKKEPRVSCSHNDKVCKARQLTAADISGFHGYFYKHKTAVSQKNFLSAYIIVEKPKRHRPNQGKSKGHAKSISVKYSIQSGAHQVPVCKKTFLSILQISRRAVDYVANKKFKNEPITKENRGGARLSENIILLQNKIEEHIKSFKCRPKHWGRAGAPNRKYLPSDLSIKKMWELFCKENSLDDNNKVSTYSLYYKVFTKKFNLGFSSVKMDRCSDCVAFSNKLKVINDDVVKRTMVVEQMLHIRRSKAFFQQLNLKPENSITINFDMMQNQPLPKTQIGEAYYKRQIWYYLLGVIICDDHGKLNQENVFFYRWLESDGGRGCTEITSCLWHFFKTNIISRNIKNIRLFSDSCSSQNKNYTLLLSLLVLAWKYKLNVEWFFPERGHSYMPADRAFGILEKKLRKKESIIFPHEYDDIVKSVGTLYTVSQDFKWMSWRDLNKSVRGMKLANIEGRLKEFPSSNHIKNEKKADVVFLLKKMGYDIENVIYYQNVLRSTQDNDNDEDSD